MPEKRRRQRVQRKAAQRRSRQLTRLAMLAVLALVAAGGYALLGAQALREAVLPGTRVPHQASPHLVRVDDAHADYRSKPPTSGPHVE
jgi:hypothetical protein